MFQDLPNPISSKMFMNLLINDTVPEAGRTGKLQANNHFFFLFFLNDNLSYELDFYLQYQNSPNVTCIRYTACHLLTRHPHKKFKQFSLLDPSGEDFLASNTFILLSQIWTYTPYLKKDETSLLKMSTWNPSDPFTPAILLYYTWSCFYLKIWVFVQNNRMYTLTE